MSSPAEFPLSSPKRDSRSVSPAAAHESSDEDSDILRPRGRLAARMQPRESESEKEGAENQTGDDDDDDDDDDDVITTRPRKLIQRRLRSPAPQDTPRRQGQSTTSSPRSPGLFITPSKPHSSTTRNNASEASDSDDNELPDPTSRNARFLALVNKKRQETEAREAEEARKKAERLAAQQQQQQLEDDDDDMSMIDKEDPDEITDDEAGRKFTQDGARPTRKASKKAMEEMNRETQRMTRSLQLAHEPKVKKKLNKSALLERFAFGAAVKSAPEPVKPQQPSSRPTSPDSAAHTDAEMKDPETPPSSAPQDGGKDVPEPRDAAATAAFNLDVDDDGELPTLEAALAASATQAKLDRGKGKAVDLRPVEPEPKQAKRRFRVKLPEVQVNRVAVQMKDDDDLEIEVTHKNKIDALFSRAPVNQAREPRPLHVLRKLAHLDDPDKKPGAAVPPKHRRDKKAAQRPAISAGELEADLLKRARTQARIERDRHLDMLRAKGVHVQTAEEREAELAQVEDIVTRARKEAEELMDREREAAKAERKAKKAAGEHDPLGWDDSDDDSEDEYREDGEEQPAEIELSGSEDEGVHEDEVDEDDESEEEAAGVLVDDAAESATESQGEDAEGQAADEDDEDELPTANTRVRQRMRKNIPSVLLEDDEEEMPSIVEATPKPKAKFPKSPSAPNTTTSPNVPTSVLRSATKSFIPGLPVAGPAGLGLTQIFAGTMDDSQTGPPAAFDTPSRPRPTFDVDAFPESNFSLTAREIGESMILDSQPTDGKTQDAETQGVQFNFSQADSLLPDTQGPSQVSELVPTQDGGYHNYSPLARRFVKDPASTAETLETIKDPESQGDAVPNQSPLVRRTGKLRRRADMVITNAASDDEADIQEEADAEVTETLQADEFGFGTSAFSVMKEVAAKEKKRKAAELCNKEKSKARELFEEQAEESEDEYAGLGGVDGEDSDDDEDAQSVKEMIDDETKNDESDERKLAAFYADRERASDEKQIEKLFHEVTTGALRRKRAGDWNDLSDDEDGGEARRRLKRRQFAKMQKALFSDERISKVAENPRNQAFLRTIENNDEADEMDFIFAPTPALVREDSEPSTTSATIPDSQPAAAAQEPPRAPAPQRRTKDGKKPSNLSEIRESLSNLLEEPLETIIPSTDPDVDLDADSDTESPLLPLSSSNKENDPAPISNNPRRTRSTAVIDRLTLKRQSSSNISTSSTRLAFSTTTTGFKPPTLLRRATTNSLISNSSSSTSSTGVTTSNHVNTAAAAGDSGKIKKSAGKRSGVSYLARENERRAAVAEIEKRRERRKWKGMEKREEVVKGLFGKGKFE